jgi:hypothetical protein
MPEILSFEPIDPTQVPENDLRWRTWYVFNHAPPDTPVPPGCTQCFICRRSYQTPPRDVLEDRMRRRFGEIPLERQVMLCADCGTIITGEAPLP